MEVGTWTELIVGIGSIAVAAVLGLLAWREAREATRWAKRATELQGWANELAETALPISLTATVDLNVFHEGEEPGPSFEAYLGLRAGVGTASVLVHRVETVGAYVSDAISFAELLGKWDVEPIPDERLPRRLHPGETIWFMNPWPSLTPTPISGSWAKVRVYYSATESSGVRSIEVDVALPGRPESSS